MEDKTVPLDDPGFLESQSRREEALRQLTEQSQIMEDEKVRFESRVDSWWNGLSEQDREWAFYSVVKRIYEGDIVKKGSYRYVLYDVFGFNRGMYIRGMDCGYMALHNSIMNDEQFAEANKWMLDDDHQRIKKTDVE
jgi:hypothetical protein